MFSSIKIHHIVAHMLPSMCYTSNVYYSWSNKWHINDVSMSKTRLSVHICQRQQSWFEINSSLNKIFYWEKILYGSMYKLYATVCILGKINFFISDFKKSKRSLSSKVNWASYISMGRGVFCNKYKCRALNSYYTRGSVESFRQYELVFANKLYRLYGFYKINKP